MRTLVALLTAGALAIGIWLASGVVTVRALDPPARIGLLAPFHVLVIAGLALLPLALWQRRRPRAGTLWLLLPIVLPWTPLPLPTAALVWSGPLAIGWWCVCVLYAHADAWAAIRERLTAACLVPTRAPWLAAAVAAVALCAGGWQLSPQHPTGDEPDYLIITQSLLTDGDLQIENNHRRAEYASYHAGVLPPSYLQRGRNGAIYSVHAPGLPLLLAPAFAVAGYHGAVAALILIAVVGAWLTWRVCWLVTEDAVASWIGWLAVIGSAPYALHAVAIFPDAPASVLALVAIRALIGDDDRSWRWLVASLALSLLPWLHTRYALIAAVLGIVSLTRLIAQRRWRALTIFAVPALTAAVAWLGFFLIVYGTPNPLAPYGAYTQMALSHLGPGLPGLLVDQQFGLLASAPVLALAALALRRTGTASQSTSRRGLFASVLAMAIGYALSVGAYRMWWGGLSAPARFLVPLLVPLAPLVAVGWQSLRSDASRHLALTLLAASLIATATLVLVDRGHLAYNVRDGQARWAVWASPLADLAGALPSAHRDAPITVVRDAAIWIGATAAAWLLWRALERRQRLTGLVTLATVAVLVPSAAATVWAAHGRQGLAPLRSQVAYLEARASDHRRALVTITLPPRGRTRNWFEIALESTRASTPGDYAVLRLDRLPAGRYRLVTAVTATGTRFGVAVGDARTTRFLAELTPTTGNQAVAFTLPVPVERLVVKRSAAAAAADGRTWLIADEVWPTRSRTPRAVASHEFGDAVLLLPEAGVFAETDGLWVAGDSDVMLGVVDGTDLPAVVSAGPADVQLTLSGGTGVPQTLTLAARTSRELVLRTDQGQLHLVTHGGFRPSHALPGSTDQRWLGVSIRPAQNRATAIR